MLQERTVGSHARVVDCEDGVFCRDCARDAKSEEELLASTPLQCEGDLIRECNERIQKFQLELADLDSSITEDESKEEKAQRKCKEFRLVRCIDGLRMQICDAEFNVSRRTGEPGSRWSHKGVL